MARCAHPARASLEESRARARPPPSRQRSRVGAAGVRAGGKARRPLACPPPARRVRSARLVRVRLRVRIRARVRVMARARARVRVRVRIRRSLCSPPPAVGCAATSLGSLGWPSRPARTPRTAAPLPLPSPLPPLALLSASATGLESPPRPARSVASAASRSTTEACSTEVVGSTIESSARLLLPSAAAQGMTSCSEVRAARRH